MNREKPKTVGELIAQLQQFSPDMRVMVDGYEGGFHDAGSPVNVDVVLNINTEWYYGPHEQHDKDVHGPEFITVVVVR